MLHDKQYLKEPMNYFEGKSKEDKIRYQDNSFSFNGEISAPAAINKTGNIK